LRFVKPLGWHWLRALPAKEPLHRVPYAKKVHRTLFAILLMIANAVFKGLCPFYPAKGREPFGIPPYKVMRDYFPF